MNDRSPHVDPRRDTMLAELLGTLDKHRRARRVRRTLARAAGGICACALAVVAARWTTTPTTPGATPLVRGADAPALPSRASARPLVEFVATRDIAREVAVSARSTTLVHFIDDEQLLAELNRQRPCYALMRAGGRVAVLDRCVR